MSTWIPDAHPAVQAIRRRDETRAAFNDGHYAAECTGQPIDEAWKKSRWANAPDGRAELERAFRQGYQARDRGEALEQGWMGSPVRAGLAKPRED